MKRVKSHLSVLFALLCVLTMSSIVAEVVEGPGGPVEFIGLEEWTVSDLIEAIKESDPDIPLHECAPVMKQSLKFPDAAAFRFFESQKDGSPTYTVVVGVENSAHVQYRTVGKESLEIPHRWEQFRPIVEETFQTHSTAAYSRFFQQLYSPNEKIFDTVFTFVEGLWAEGFDEEIERSMALKALVHDERWSVRFIATLVLTQSPENDTSWHALVESLIDPAPQVRGIAIKLLQLLVLQDQADPVRWLGARDALVALLGGTNPFAFTEILNVLVATEIDPQLGKELVQERPQLLLAHVAAEHEKTREKAATFLKFISGEDFEQDVEAWEEWIDTDDPTSVP